MITEHDLDEAIAECLGQKNPTAQTCIKLAAFYTIKNELNSKNESPTLSFSTGTVPEEVVNIGGSTAFLKKIDQKPIHDVLYIFDDLMTTLFVINRPLYEKIMREI